MVQPTLRLAGASTLSSTPAPLYSDKYRRATASASRGASEEWRWPRLPARPKQLQGQHRPGRTFRHS